MATGRIDALTRMLMNASRRGALKAAAVGGLGTLLAQETAVASKDRKRKRRRKSSNPPAPPLVNPCTGKNVCINGFGDVCGSPANNCFCLVGLFGDNIFAVLEDGVDECNQCPTGQICTLGGATFCSSPPDFFPHVCATPCPG